MATKLGKSSDAKAKVGLAEHRLKAAQQRRAEARMRAVGQRLGRMLLERFGPGASSYGVSKFGGKKLGFQVLVQGVPAKKVDLPATIGGYPVRVEMVGRIVAAARTSRVK